VLKPCPNEFGFFERQSIIRLLNKYDCNYNYFNGTTYDNYLFNINTTELEDINNIKLLKQKDFPLNFFCKDEIIKKKRMSKNMLLEAGYTFEDFQGLSVDNLLKLDIDREYVIQVLKNKSTIPNKSNRLDLETFLRLRFTIPELIKIGFNPLYLYAKYYNDHDLAAHYLNLERQKDEDEDEVQGYLLQLLTRFSINSTYDTLLKKLISVNNLKSLTDFLNKNETFKIAWDIDGQIIPSYTLEEQDKIKGIKPLEDKDKTVRFRYVGTPTEFKRAGFTPVELKDEFTLDELRKTFTPDELRKAGFTI